MKLLYALTALLALSSPSLADHPMPQVPEGGFTVVFTSKCTDKVTEEKGDCAVMQDKAGNYYTVFLQDNEVMFIRRPLPEGGYEDLWVSHLFQGI
jgi:hypothetical protein